jgi:hypothetical protein
VKVELGELRLDSPHSLGEIGFPGYIHIYSFI